MAKQTLNQLMTPEQRAMIDALPLFDHQRDFVNAQLDSLASELLAGQPGTGKTLTAISLAMAVTFAKANTNTTAPTVYAMPANLVVQVSREFKRFAPHLRLAMLRTGKDKIPAKEQFDVLLVSYTLPVANRKIAEAIAALAPYAMLVFDESALLRSVKAQRTKYWIGLTRKARWTLMMSGTPMINSPEDLYTSCLVLGLLGPELGETYGEFCRKFVVYKQMMFGRQTVWKAAGGKNLDVLNRIMATRTTRWESAKLLSLPRVIHGTHYLDIPDVMGELMAGRVDPSPAMRTLQELMASGADSEQIAEAAAKCGQLELATYRRAIGAVKAAGVAEMVAGRLADGGAPSLVFGHHRQALQIIADKLTEMGVKTGLIFGDTSASRRDKQVVAFQNGELQALVLQIDVAGLGLNLQAAGYVAFAELPWTAAAYEQAIARAQRAGQTQRVQVDVVTVPDSLDEAMIRIIRRKAGETEAVFGQQEEVAA